MSDGVMIIVIGFCIGLVSGLAISAYLCDGGYVHENVLQRWAARTAWRNKRPGE